MTGSRTAGDWLRLLESDISQTATYTVQRVDGHHPDNSVQKQQRAKISSPNNYEKDPVCRVHVTLLDVIALYVRLSIMHQVMPDVIQRYRNGHQNEKASHKPRHHRLLSPLAQKV